MNANIENTNQLYSNIKNSIETSIDRLNQLKQANSSSKQCNSNSQVNKTSPAIPSKRQTSPHVTMKTDPNPLNGRSSTPTPNIHQYNPSISSLKSAKSSFHAKPMNQHSKNQTNGNQMTESNVNIVDKVSEDLRNFYEKMIETKDDQIRDLKTEVQDLKDMLKSRTEQANDNVKKMAKINMNLKQEIDQLRSVNKSLENDLNKAKNEQVKLNDIDDCYQRLRKEKHELLIQNEDLKTQLKSFKSNFSDNNNRKIEYKNQNIYNQTYLSNNKPKQNSNLRSQTPELNNKGKSNEEQQEKDILHDQEVSSMRFRSPNVNKREVNFNSDAVLSIMKSKAFENDKNKSDTKQYSKLRDTQDNIDTTIGTVSSHNNETFSKDREVSQIKHIKSITNISTTDYKIRQFRDSLIKSREKSQERSRRQEVKSSSIDKFQSGNRIKSEMQDRRSVNDRQDDFKTTSNVNNSANSIVKGNSTRSIQQLGNGNLKRNDHDIKSSFSEKSAALKNKMNDIASKQQHLFKNNNVENV